MFLSLLFLHSLFRWLVLISLVASIFKSLSGYHKRSSFTTWDNRLRHWTATIAHIQLAIGIVVYTKSYLVAYYFSSQTREGDAFFFGILHITLMLIAIALVTIGSAKAKREKESRKKFTTILVFYTLALLCILSAIPWPFSPLAQRPFFRTF